MPPDAKQLVAWVDGPPQMGSAKPAPFATLSTAYKPEFIYGTIRLFNFEASARDQPKAQKNATGCEAAGGLGCRPPISNPISPSI